MIQPIFSTFLMVIVFVLLTIFTEQTFLIFLTWVLNLVCFLLLFKLAIVRSEIEIIEGEYK